MGNFYLGTARIRVNRKTVVLAGIHLFLDQLADSGRDDQIELRFQPQGKTQDLMPHTNAKHWFLAAQQRLRCLDASLTAAGSPGPLERKCSGCI